MVNTRSGAYLQLHHDYNSGQYSTSANFVQEGSALNTLWPVLADMTGPPWAGPKSATLKVHKYALNGTPVWTNPANLGEVRAYDLQADVCPLSDGQHFAVLSSRYTIPYNASNPMTHDDLTTTQQDCLTNTFSYDTDPGTGTSFTDWDNNEGYGYWNTDAVVWKLRLADKSEQWELQFDTEDGAAAECSPGDLKNQECMYRITEADDGGLVVSGNTSHNQDDCYLAKIGSDCQATQDFASINAMLDANGEVHITSPTTWNTGMNVRGQVFVEPGASLTVNAGATLRFADSEQLNPKTRLIVRPGGKLYVNGGATLTSMDQCPGSVWDGIQVHGISTQPQDPVTNSPQGLATLNNATVENARVALLTASSPAIGELPWPILKNSTGGIVRATNTTFHNNRMDVDFRPYENHELNPPDQIANNRSFFTLCNFTVDAQLPDGTMPLEHASMATVRGIPFRGCTFAGVNYVDLERRSSKVPAPA